MIKRKFGDELHARCLTMRKKEVKLKHLVYNFWEVFYGTKKSKHLLIRCINKVFETTGITVMTCLERGE